MMMIVIAHVATVKMMITAAAIMDVVPISFGKMIKEHRSKSN
jgi:hypothetical protein